MNLKNILKLLFKYKLFIIICCLFTVSAACYYSVKCLKNQYRTSAVMVINSLKNSKTDDNLTYTDYSLNVNLVNSYRVLCKTGYIMYKVRADTGLPFTVGQLSSKITVNSVYNTEIFTITVSDENPATAALIANSTAAVFEKEIPFLMKMDNVKIIDVAPVPSSPYFPKRKLTVCIALFGTLAFCCGVILLKEYLDTSVKSEEELEGLLGVPVISSVPHTNVRRLGEK